MRIELNGLPVANQDQALAFYTRVLGFVPKFDLAFGEFRWLTVVSSEAPDGAQLVLEPVAFPATATYQKALFEAGIPATAFRVDDIQGEYKRLCELGVVFRGEPTEMCGSTSCIFEDTCGNLISLYQVSLEA